MIPAVIPGLQVYPLYHKFMVLGIGRTLSSIQAVNELCVHSFLEYMAQHDPGTLLIYQHNPTLTVFCWGPD